MQAVDTESLDLGDRRLARPQKLSVSKHGMVATAHYRATESAAEVLAAGGNAMDAAVTAAFALGVCEPAASGIGGQTMMLIHDAESRRKIVLDGSSRAPHRVPPGELAKHERLRGHRATTVPSTPAALGYGLKRYGTMSLRDVLEPAIRLADEGFVVTRLKHDLAKREIEHLRAGTAAPLFLREGRDVYPVGAVLKQPALGATLRRVAEVGVEDFYQGDIAREIHEDMVRHDGLIRDDDLAQIPWPIERRPLSTRFDGMRVFTVGPPGAGRVLVEMLNIMRHFPEKQRDPDTPEGAVLLAEVIRQSNIDRQDRPYDPHLHAQEPEERMLSHEYARKVARGFRKRIRGHGDTTHLSVMDKWGNVVALTQSIERVFGSFAASPKLGFLYNNYMSAFEYEDMSHPHYLRPNAVPWASVAPTIIFRGRVPWVAIGSPGSERIASTVMQVLLRLEQEPPFEAVNAPRLHCSLHGKVSLESTRMRDDIPDALREHGFDVEERDPYSFYLGCVQLVMRDRGGELIGVADPRRDGSASGPRRRENGATASAAPESRIGKPKAAGWTPLPGADFENA